MKTFTNKAKLKIKYPSLFAGLIIVLFWFVVYAIRVPSHFLELPFTGESLIIAKSGGVFRSPGAPLYTLLLEAFAKADTTPQTINVLNAALAALTLGFTYVTSLNILKRLRKVKMATVSLFSDQLNDIVLAALAVSALAISKQFSLSAIAINPQTLNLLLLSITLFLWSQAIVSLKSYISLLLGLITGIGLAHSQVFLAVLPLIIHVGVLHSLKKKYSEVVWMVLALLFGVVGSYLVLALTVDPTAQFSWLFERDVSTIMEFATKPVVSDRFNPFQLLGQPLDQLGPGHIVGGARRLLVALPSIMGITPLLLGLFGIIAAILTKKHYFTSILFSLVLFLLYSSTLLWPDSWENRAILYQHYLVAFPFIIILVTIGFQFLINRLGKGISILTDAKKTSYIVLALIALPLLIEAVAYAPQVSVKNNTLANDYAAQIMDNAQENSIVTCYTTFSCGALFSHEAYKENDKNVVVVPIMYRLLNQDTWDDLTGFDFNSEPWLFLDLISWNIKDTAVYAADLNQNYYSSLGFDNNIMYYLPEGYAARLVQAMPEEIPEYTYPASVDAADDISTWNASLIAHKMMLSRSHIYNGVSYIKMGLRQRGKQEINLASNILQNISPKERDEIIFIGTNIERMTSQENYTPGSEVKSTEFYLDLIPDYLEKGNASRAFLAAKAAYLINPRDARSHLALAKIFERGGDVDFARIELNYALKLDPTLEEAKELLEQLSSGQ